MRTLYCWRCKQDVVMLDEDEFALVEPHYMPGIKAVKDFRRDNGAPLEAVDRPRCFRDLLDAYERITGDRPASPDAIMHHRVSMYGPLCHACGKPLRTPQARHCAACGAWFERPSDR